MKKSLFTKIGAIALGLGLLVTVGVSLAHTNVSEAKADTTTTLISWSQSSTVGGTFTSTNTSSKKGYIQDGTSGTISLQVLSTSALISSEPKEIAFSAKLGGGATKASGVAMKASLLDSSGAIIDGATVTLTDKITEKTGSIFTTTFDTANWSKVYGVKIYHDKIESWNARYYSFELTSTVEGGSTPVSSINIVPESVYLPIGGTKVVSANVLPAAATDNTVTWSLSDVNPSGSVTWDASTLTLTGVSEGAAKLTATANDGSGVFDAINVNVVDAYKVAITSSVTSDTVLTSSNIGSYISADVALTYSTLTKLYASSDNFVKFGASSSAGVFKFSIPSTDSYLVDKVIILGKGFSGDTSTVSVNESEAITFASDTLNYYVFDITDGLEVNIKGTTASNGRFYISEILLVKVKSSTPLVSIDNAPTTLASLAEGTFTATVTNATTYTIAWTSSDSNVIEVQDDGSYETGEAGKATITATITVNGVQYSDAADIVVLEHDGLSATNAFTTTEAKLVIDNNLKVSGKTYYVTGTISEISYAWSDTSKNLSYIITDGTTEFTLYKMSAIVDPDLAVNATVTAYAAASKLVLYNTTYELNGCTYADPDCTEVEDFIDAYMHMTDYDTKFDNSEGTGACSGENGYYAEAKAYFNDMTSRQRSVFVAGTDYAKAYARLQAWATANGEVFGTDNVLGTATSGSQLLKLVNDNNAAVIIVMVTAMTASLGAAFYFMLRKKKAQ